jgi:hypothetical protein
MKMPDHAAVLGGINWIIGFVFTGWASVLAVGKAMDGIAIVCLAFGPLFL